MKAIGYVRVSTDEQVSNGISLDAQEKKIRDYCKDKDWTLIDVVRDGGVSAKNIKRHGLKSILDRIPKKKNRGFDAIIVAKLDRLTRSVRDLGDLNEKFEAKKVSFVSILENVDTSTATGDLFCNVVASISQWERKIISERTRDALQFKRRNGQLAGEIPYGYRVNEDGKTLEPISEEQEVIKTIKSLRESSLSYGKIADLLNEKGIATKKGSIWYGQTVWSVLLHAS